MKLKPTLAFMALALASLSCCKNSIDYVESPVDYVSTLVGTESPVFDTLILRYQGPRAL